MRKWRHQNVNLLKVSQQEDSDIFSILSLCWLLEKKDLSAGEPSGWWPPPLRWSRPQFTLIHTVFPQFSGGDEAWALGLLCSLYSPFPLEPLGPCTLNQAQAPQSGVQYVKLCQIYQHLLWDVSKIYKPGPHSRPSEPNLWWGDP